MCGHSPRAGVGEAAELETTAAELQEALVKEEEEEARAEAEARQERQRIEEKEREERERFEAIQRAEAARKAEADRQRAGKQAPTITVITVITVPSPSSMPLAPSTFTSPHPPSLLPIRLPAPTH